MFYFLVVVVGVVFLWLGQIYVYRDCKKYLVSFRFIIILVFLISRCVGICNQINLYLWLMSISDKFVLFNIILMNRVI